MLFSFNVITSGPSSVGVDFSLHGFDHVYGIPQHAESLLLKNTSDGDAYRLYNLDIFGHKIHEKIGIYGSVPLLLAHKPNTTSGIFWLNSSETLVDINTKAVAEVRVAYFPRNLISKENTTTWGQKQDGNITGDRSHQLLSTNM